MKKFSFILLFCLASISFGYGKGIPSGIGHEIVPKVTQIENVLPKNLLDDIIQQIIELLKGILLDIIPLPHIPPLNINEPLLKIHLALEGLEIHGTKTFNVTRVKSNIILLDAEVDFCFPDPIMLKGEYEIDGTFGYVFPIFGKGPFSLEIHDLCLTGGARLTLIPPSVKSVRYNIFSFGKLVTNFEGLVGGELGDVISEIIADLGYAIFNYIEPVINPLICDALVDIINWILANGLLP